MTALTAWPAPTGPTWVIVLPRSPRIGRARSTSAASPPTKIVRVRLLGALGAARDGGVDEVDALRGQASGEVAGGRRRDRRAVDHERARAGAGGHAVRPEQDRLRRRACRRRRSRRRRSPRPDVAGVGRLDRPDAIELGGPARRPVPDRQADGRRGRGGRPSRHPSSRGRRSRSVPRALLPQLRATSTPDDRPGIGRSPGSASLLPMVASTLTGERGRRVVPGGIPRRIVLGERAGRARHPDRTGGRAGCPDPQPPWPAVRPSSGMSGPSGRRAGGERRSGAGSKLFRSHLAPIQSLDTLAESFAREAVIPVELRRGRPRAGRQPSRVAAAGGLRRALARAPGRETVRAMAVARPVAPVRSGPSVDGSVDGFRIVARGPAQRRDPEPVRRRRRRRRRRVGRLGTVAASGDSARSRRLATRARPAAPVAIDSPR